MWGFGALLRRAGTDFGFTSIITYGCVALYIASLVIAPRAIGMNGLSMLSPGTNSLFLLGASGAIPVFRYDRWWTVLSAAWLHGNLLHIFFNLMWLRQLAPEVSELYGASRAAVIYTVASIVGFSLSSLAGYFFGGIPIIGGAAFTVGASASIFGLLGALVLYGRRAGSSHIRSQAMSYAVVLFLFGFIMPNVDNYAHLGGFIGGYVTAQILDPLRPERTDHFIAAIICIALTVLSVAASIVTGLI
jgi:rhomboid protease GluP